MYFVHPVCGLPSTQLLRAGAVPPPHLEQLGSPSSTPGPKHHSFRGTGASSVLLLPTPRWGEATGPPLLPSPLGPGVTQQDSWPPWAALRAPHGHATRVPPRSMAEQGCSPSPVSIQQPAALHCWHCYLYPFHLHTLVSIRNVPQLVPARVHGEMPELLSSSAPGSPVKH